MLELINERVSVITIYDRDKGEEAYPYQIKWQGRKYTITKVGYHHKIRIGRAIHHIYSVCDDTTAFKLRLDSESLIWILEEVSDGSTN